MLPRFTLPASARRVAESDATANQAFVFGDRLVGLQFHPEIAAITPAELDGRIVPVRREHVLGDRLAGVLEVGSPAAPPASLAITLPHGNNHSRARGSPRHSCRNSRTGIRPAFWQIVPVHRQEG